MFMILFQMPGIKGSMHCLSEHTLAVLLYIIIIVKLILYLCIYYIHVFMVTNTF